MSDYRYNTQAMQQELGKTGFAHLEGVDFKDVEIRDEFWSPRLKVNSEVTSFHCLQMLEKAGNLHNLRLAAEGKRDGFKGPRYIDSDLFKAMEGIAYILTKQKNPELERQMDEIVDLIESAQEEDGYLNSWHQVTRPDRKWMNLRDDHELYCAGHLFEAAIAYDIATGKRKLLDVALKYAEHIYEVFYMGGREGYCGHPEIEIALIKLWKHTGDKKWYDLCVHMLKQRGGHFFAREHGTPEEEYDGTYWIDDVPIEQHNEIKGHAVRAAYLMAGITDVVSETEDQTLFAMLERVWTNMILKRTYVTGGIGTSAHNEGFTSDYDLPNESAYQETCASIALVLWGYRMGYLTGEAKYFDAIEIALYNAILSGVSLDGTKFFYDNPLESDGSHSRKEWYECACCPPNILRVLGYLGGLIYAVGEKDLFVNLYIGNELKTDVRGKVFEVSMTSWFPWAGKVEIQIGTEGEVNLHLRKPEWCESVKVFINGNEIYDFEVQKGYIVLQMEWKKNDRVELEFDMPVKQVIAHPNVKQDRGHCAIRKGPILYCAESADNVLDFQSVFIPRNTDLRFEFRDDFLGGAGVVMAKGEEYDSKSWEGKLYQDLPAMRETTVTMLPYAFWNNRGSMPMKVWFMM